MNERIAKPNQEQATALSAPACDDRGSKAVVSEPKGNVDRAGSSTASPGAYETREKPSLTCCDFHDEPCCSLCDEACPYCHDFNCGEDCQPEL